MRLDKFLAEAGIGSRKEIKGLLKKKLVYVNGKVVKEAKSQVQEYEDEITFAGERVTYQKFFYYMLHKPPGVISATEDRAERTVLDLFSREDYRSDLFPVGRLDKDTEGLLLVTNDGALAHQLLSPKKHVDKEYTALVAGVVTEEDIALFAQGFTLKSGETVRPSQLEITKIYEAERQTEIRLVIQEGKFHQVKRMLASVGKKVLYLKRLRMGELILDETLPLGKYRPLTDQEVMQLIKK
ncbi:pseudouridine synthase [Enterococcus faecalis]